MLEPTLRWWITRRPSSPRLALSTDEAFDVATSNVPSKVLCILTSASLLDVVTFEVRVEVGGASAYWREIGELELRAETLNVPPVLDCEINDTSDLMGL